MTIAKPTDAEILAIVRRYANGVMTYVVRNILASTPRGPESHAQPYPRLDTAFVRRRLMAMEKAGQVKRVRSGYATMICWSIA
ncbi:hypothetical protein QE363_000774 [Sphingomonas sp. SORGH_AS870]|uniref:hypothetical protein n=1 Tax=Sphingomonas sp. SORGH_AS_0870 TaxID=3041801 RepID=UPI00285C37E7|nr:hypothetical protein [Sphingomonas sp. SORGH_AS_0870]MDR6144981.1 hypothetical protein [Sphingomonas sp. SORGH_AS_0870]